MGFATTPFDRLAEFVSERERIRLLRAANPSLPPPWTKDRILQSARFTNVRRANDPGTEYARALALDAAERFGAGSALVWLAVYRLCASPYREDRWGPLGGDVIEELVLTRAHAQPVRPGLAARLFGNAYMVNSYAGYARRKADAVAEIAALLETSRAGWAAAAAATTREGQWQALKAQPGLGGFVAFQVLVDASYPWGAGPFGVGGTLLPLLNGGNDGWCYAGPGAWRGLGRLWRGLARRRTTYAVRTIREALVSHRASAWVGALELADVCNVLCEWDKYERLREGGRPRRRYTFAGGTE